MTTPSHSFRRFAAISIYVLAVGWGVHAAVGYEDSVNGWVISVGLAVASTVWCVTDASARKSSLLWPARIGIFLFWPIGVPAYLVWSRGLRGLLTALLAVGGWLALMFAAFLVSGYLAYGSAWWGRA